jgi:hypothetical protein
MRRCLAGCQIRNAKWAPESMQSAHDHSLYSILHVDAMYPNDKPPGVDCVIRERIIG